ncbi:MutS protein msh5, partial [Podochytrium sp. JEL0797]
MSEIEGTATILAVSLSASSGLLGAACFETSSGTLSVCEDTPDVCFDAAAKLIHQTAPTTVLVNARSGAAFVSFAQTLLGNRCETRPSKDFAYKVARARFASADLSGLASRALPVFAFAQTHNENTKNELFLESVASLENVLMVGCVGALLLHLAGDHEIRRIEALKLDSFMTLNKDAMTSLNIFSDQKHPNMFSSDNKEGLSLFGLMNLTRSPLGKSLLTKWFLSPSIDLAVIESRQAAVRALLLPRNRDAVDVCKECLAFVSNIPRICIKLSKKLGFPEWQSLLKFAFYALKMRTIATTFDAVLLQDVVAHINRVIDFELSSAESKVVVKLGVDQELDELKHLYEGLDDLLSEVATETARSVPPQFVDGLNVVYFPQLGYLITVALQSHMTTKESFEIQGLLFQFCTTKHVFYKSDRMYEMDESMGDLHSIIADKEMAILQTLQDDVARHASLLTDISAVCAELDCLIAFADCAERYHLVCPEMVDSPNVLEIQQGRHPLYEQCMDSFIGNDTHFGDHTTTVSTDSNASMDEDDDSMRPNNASHHRSDSIDSLDDSSRAPRVVVLTGPNFSGKSVYLKQVGLIVFMAHLGSFVSAGAARVGVTDRIMTRVQA